MVKVKHLVFLIVSSFALFGCNQEGEVSLIEEQPPKQEEQLEEQEEQIEEKELTRNEAIALVIEHHNTTDEKISGYMFPRELEEGKVATVQIAVGGKCCNNYVQLDQSVEVLKQDGSFIVTLKENYNMTFNGKEAISYWKYGVTKDEITLLEKDEYGYRVHSIK